MKKTALITICLFVFTSLFSQQNYSDYFEGKRTYCSKPSDKRSLEIFDLGIKCIHQNVYLGSASQIFHDLIKTDSTFCDAYFWAGYTLKLSNDNIAAASYYYIADSLAQNKSIEFKQNLATTCMQIGATDLARKKYKEITEYFPSSPEGYYGIALTSTIIGDIDFGLENINIAEKKYSTENKDTQYLKAILLTLNGRYWDSLKYFEESKKKYSKEDYFNGHYTLSLYEVGKSNNDENMLKLAKKHYKKVKDKDKLSEELKNKLE